MFSSWLRHQVFVSPAQGPSSLWSQFPGSERGNDPSCGCLVYLAHKLFRAGPVHPYVSMQGPAQGVLGPDWASHC